MLKGTMKKMKQGNMIISDGSKGVEIEVVP